LDFDLVDHQRSRLKAGRAHPTDLPTRVEWVREV
jgi:hypothetical protein